MDGTQAKIIAIPRDRCSNARAYMASPESLASQISVFFNTYRGTPVNIEFHSPYPTNLDLQLLIDGPNIAIPKPFLIKAFISANATFTSLLARSLDPERWSTEDAKALLDASLILLLVGAENSTAVNTRRRILLRGGLGAVTPREEVRWLEGVLTSPLAKHNKSPLLWHYRRWLVERYGLGILGEEGLEGEMKVVERSGEAHPRNYYAWNYARFITNTFYVLHRESISPIRVLIDKHAMFCLAHVSDTSCWSFLLFLFFKTVENAETAAAVAPKEHIFDITNNVMCFAHGTARGHESIWVFLKTVLASSELLESNRRVQLVELVERWVGKEERGCENDESEEVKERELEKKALEWIRGRGKR